MQRVKDQGSSIDARNMYNTRRKNVLASAEKQLRLFVYYTQLLGDILYSRVRDYAKFKLFYF